LPFKLHPEALHHGPATENLLVVLQHVSDDAANVFCGGRVRDGAIAETRAVAAEAVALGGGVVPFNDPRQRPNVFIPELEAKPWWGGARWNQVDP
jgi:hypothetical protein